MKTDEEIKSKLKELYEIREAIEEADDSSSREAQDELTAINNQIMILEWVLAKEKYYVLDY